MIGDDPSDYAIWAIGNLSAEYHVRQADNTVVKFNNIGIALDDLNDQVVTMTLTKSGGNLTIDINGNSGTKAFGDFDFDALGSTRTDRDWDGFILDLEVISEHKWVNSTAFQDEIGAVNGTTQGSFNSINIYGHDYNSTTDIFGNSFQYEWKEGMLNGLGGNHTGVNCGASYSTAGIEHTIIFAAYSNTTDIGTILANRANADGFKLYLQNDRIGYVNENGGTAIVALTPQGSWTQAKWVFGKVHISAAGLVNFYIRDESGTFTPSGSEDQNVGIPGDGTTNLWFGARGNGGDAVKYPIIPPISKLGNITNEEADQVVEYWKTKIINAAGN